MQRDELAQKSRSGRRPRLAVITSAGFHAQGLAILEPERAQLIKARLTYAGSMAGLAGGEDIGREVGQGLADEIGGKSVDDLALLIVGIEPAL